MFAVPLLRLSPVFFETSLKAPLFSSLITRAQVDKFTQKYAHLPSRPYQKLMQNFKSEALPDKEVIHRDLGAGGLSPPPQLCHSIPFKGQINSLIVKVYWHITLTSIFERHFLNNIPACCMALVYLLQCWDEAKQHDAFWELQQLVLAKISSL